ncbi:hypothetical protein BIV60_00590 [Bacillus sp. MUM 116]|nr:hypothetical protein BIV60_00590 [Bacillus sp. MUM 116]
MGEPRDIGNAVVFLASNEAKFITFKNRKKVKNIGGNEFRIWFRIAKILINLLKKNKKRQ